MLANTKFLLEQARLNYYAIPHTNFCDLHTLRAILDTCVSENVPVILGLAEGHFKYIDIESAACMAKHFAQRCKIPVALHLDHGQSFETVKKAIDCGFTSVMLDASMKSFEENVRCVSEVVAYAHAFGVTVEAEIGHVGEGENYNATVSDMYTDPEEAKRFAELTGVDSLAVAVGTAHGPYKGTPKIDFDRLRTIRHALDIPLVLHGSSGTGHDNIKKCVECGINKVNIFTDLAQGATDAIAPEIDTKFYQDFIMNGEAGIRKVLKAYIDTLSTRKWNNK